MNDIFNLKRFLRYARLYYAKKWLAKVTPLAATAFAILLFCSNLSVSSDINDTFSTLHAAKQDLTQQFVVIFFLAGFALTILSVRVLCGGLDAGNKRFLMQDILIPASSTERYCFGLLNTIVVIPLLYLLIFWCTSTYAESLYYFPTDGTTTSYIYKGLLDFNPITIPAGYEQVDLFNLKSLSINDGESSLSLFAFAAAYLLIVSILMWGEVTFARNGVIFAWLVHIVIIALIGSATLVAFESYKAAQVECDLTIIHAYSVSLGGSLSTIIALMIPTLIYQVITFLKIKNLSVNN